MSERVAYSERLLIEALAISGRFAVLDEVTTRLMPHSFSTLVEAERYVDLLLHYQQAGFDPEAAAAAVGGESLEQLRATSSIYNLTPDAHGDDDDEADSYLRGWATVSPDHARVGGPVPEWMTTYPHRRAISPAELAEHMDRLSKHGHSFALVAFAQGRITEVARLERGEEPYGATPQPQPQASR